MRVLYATDGGAAAVDAGRLLEALARRDDVEVLAGSVVPTGTPELRHLNAVLRSDDARQASARDAVDAAVSGLRGAGFAVEGVVREGRSAATLTQIATDEAVDLIVVGSGVRWIGGRLLGSVSTHLLHNAPTSVLIAHTPPRTTPAAIVAGVDGSDCALHAVDVAARLLDPQRCAFTVVAVGTLMAPTMTPPYAGYAVSAPTPEVEADVLAPAHEHADAAVKALTGRGFDAHAHVVLGHPVRRLMTTVDDVGASVAVVGSRGLGALDRAAIGSVSDQVARHAPATLVGRRPG